MAPEPDSPAIAAAVEARHTELVTALTALDEAAFDASSSLPGWSRLTVVSHLRYGAEASERLVADTLAGRATAFYPGGRELDRPASLRPRQGESARDVVRSFAAASGRLDNALRRLDPPRWELTIEELATARDLGPITLRTVALLRLTEVEVHGSDLDLGGGLDRWSETFCAAALPMRLRWLETRRSNHRAIATDLSGSWRLTVIDGPSFQVTLDGDRVRVVESPVSGPSPGPEIAGSGADVLGFLLGRTPLERLRVRGDLDAASRFLAAFPPP